MGFVFLAQDGDKVAEFVGDEGEVGFGEGGGDLGFHVVAEAAAEAVDGNFEGGFVHVERAGGFGLGEVIRVAGEPGFEGFEELLFVFGFVFFGELGEGAIEDGEGPFSIEFEFGGKRVRIGDLDFGGGGGGVVVEGLERGAGVAFGGLVAVVHVGEEMFYGGEEI